MIAIIAGHVPALRGVDRVLEPSRYAWPGHLPPSPVGRSPRGRHCHRFRHGSGTLGYGPNLCLLSRRSVTARHYMANVCDPRAWRLTIRIMIQLITVTYERNPMDLLLLRLHQKQIAHQCYAALNAVRQADSALDVSDQKIFWMSIQNLLTAAANIAKACWGAGGRLSEQRSELRESLIINDSSPLANTDLRNHLEHYDERLDRWYNNSVARNYADFIIGPRESTIVGLEETDIFRFFDPKTKEVIFWGERYAMEPLITELYRIASIATNESEKPPW